MTNVLYQKYRPHKFSELFGQLHVKVAIENQLATGKIAHAYLFCGPRAVGKTTIARLLASAVNCENRKVGESEPCNECPSCREIRQGSAMDVIEIDAASHTGVDNVRENIIASARITPAKMKYKVFIIDEVHMLSVSAFNALLKTLEEPPANVIFILATTEIHKVPPTIISRCQRYDFKKISVQDIVDKLNYIVSEEGRDVEKEVLQNIAAQSEGCLRDAESLLGQILFLDDKKITLEKAELIIPKSNYNSLIEFYEFLFSGSLEKSIYLVNKLGQEGVDLKQFTKDLIVFSRKIILIKVGGGLEYFGTEFDEEIEKRILKIAEANGMEKIIRAIELFLEAQDNLKRCDIITLPLELAVLKFITNPEESGNSFIAEARVRSQAIDHDSFKKVSQATKNIDMEKPLQADDKPQKEETEILQTVHDEKRVLENKDKSEISENLPKSEKKTKANNLTIELIQKKWEEVIENVKLHNPSLCFVLKVSNPFKIEDNVITLAHSCSFHMERVQDLKNKQALEKVLNDIFEEVLILEGIVDENFKVTMNNDSPREFEEPLKGLGEEKTQPETKENSLFQDVLSEFGGEVVN